MLAPQFLFSFERIKKLALKKSVGGRGWPDPHPPVHGYASGDRRVSRKTAVITKQKNAGHLFSWEKLQIPFILKSFINGINVIYHREKNIKAFKMQTQKLLYFFGCYTTIFSHVPPPFGTRIHNFLRYRWQSWLINNYWHKT
jgi:hypothetical protein